MWYWAFVGISLPKYYFSRYLHLRELYFFILILFVVCLLIIYGVIAVFNSTSVIARIINREITLCMGVSGYQGQILTIAHKSMWRSRGSNPRSSSFSFSALSTELVVPTIVFICNLRKSTHSSLKWQLERTIWKKEEIL